MAFTRYEEVPWLTATAERMARALGAHLGDKKVLDRLAPAPAGHPANGYVNTDMVSELARSMLPPEAPPPEPAPEVRDVEAVEDLDALTDRYIRRK